MEQIANSSFSNLLHVFFQMIAIVGWFVLLVKIEDKKKYLCQTLYWLLYGVASLMIYTLLKELINHKFNLEWNLPTWYPINLMLVLVVFVFIDKIEELKDNIDEKGND